MAKRKGIWAANPVIAAAVDRCFRYAEQLQRGDLFTYSDLERCSGLKRNGKHWARTMDRLRERIRVELKISTWFRPNYGLMLLKADDQLKFIPCHRKKKARTQHRKILAAVSVLPEDGLSDRQKQLRLLELDEVAKLNRANLMAERLSRALRDGGGNKQPRYDPR